MLMSKVPLTLTNFNCLIMNLGAESTMEKKMCLFHRYSPSSPVGLAVRDGLMGRDS